MTTPIFIVDHREIQLNPTQGRTVTQQWCNHITRGYHIDFDGHLMHNGEEVPFHGKKLRSGEYNLIVRAIQMNNAIEEFIRANSGDNGK